MIEAYVFREAAGGGEQAPVCEALVLAGVFRMVNQSQAPRLQSAAQQRHAADELDHGELHSPCLPLTADGWVVGRLWVYRVRTVSAAGTIVFFLW